MVVGTPWEIVNAAEADSASSSPINILYRRVLYWRQSWKGAGDVDSFFIVTILIVVGLEALFAGCGVSFLRNRGLDL